MARPNEGKKKIGTCVVCGRQYRYYPSKDGQRRFCSQSCSTKWKTKNTPLGFKKGHITWNKGMQMPEDIRKKMSEGRRRYFENGGVSSAKGKPKSPETKEKIRRKLQGRTLSAADRKKVSDGVLRSYARIDAEALLLREQGFYVIPITRIVPDIIAMKDGKVYAVEVEYGVPNYEKYTEDFRGLFSDVIWIIKHG